MKLSFSRYLFFLLILIPFSALSCNCGFSLKFYYKNSVSAHLIKVTEMKLVESKGDSAIEVTFENIETLTKIKTLPEKLYLINTTCTKKLVPGVSYVVFIPRPGDNSFKFAAPAFSNETIVSSCSGVYEIGSLNNPRNIKEFDRIKAQIQQLDNQGSNKVIKMDKNQLVWGGIAARV